MPGQPADRVLMDRFLKIGTTLCELAIVLFLVGMVVVPAGFVVVGLIDGRLK